MEQQQEKKKMGRPSKKDLLERKRKALNPELQNFQKQILINDYAKSLKDKDFKKFCSFIEIQSETDGRMSFHYDKWREPQKLFEETRTKKDVVLKPRRIGFTTMELVRDLFYALTNPGKSVCIVAHTDNLAHRMILEIQKICSNIEKLEKKLSINNVSPKFLPDKHIWSATQLVFSTGSEIFVEVAKSQENSAERTGRGVSINRLHCTEVAFWTYADLTMKALMTAASNADEIIIESTPNGSSGYFYDFFWRIEQGEVPGEEWKNHFYPWHCLNSYRTKLMDKETISMVPENAYEETLIKEYQIDSEQLKWWRTKVAIHSLESVIQEYPIDVETCFRVKSSTFLEQADFIYLSSCISEPIDELMFENNFGKPLRVWIHPEPRNSYVIGSDVAYGIESDHSTICVVDNINGEICASYSNNKIKPHEFGLLLKEVAEYYNNALIAIEGIGPGRTTIQALEEKRYANLYKPKGAKQNGWVTTQVTRINLFNLYQQLITQKEIKVVDIELVNEARTLIYANSRVDHAKGATSDRTFAFAIAQTVRREHKRSNNSADSIWTSSKAQLQNNFSFGRPRFR